MKKPLARFRGVGSFIAGFLIGLSIIVGVYATIVVNPSAWQMLWIFGAPIILAAGLTLQIVLTTKDRRAYETPEPKASPSQIHAVVIHDR